MIYFPRCERKGSFPKSKIKSLLLFSGTSKTRKNAKRHYSRVLGYISDKDNYQYYQNTTKGFEFTDANFKVKAQSKIAKGDK